MIVFTVEVVYSNGAITPRFRGAFSTPAKAKQYIMRCLKTNGTRLRGQPCARLGVNGQWIGTDTNDWEWTITEEMIDSAQPY